MTQIISAVATFLVSVTAIAIIFPALYPYFTTMHTFGTAQGLLPAYVTALNNFSFWKDYIWVPLLLSITAIFFLTAILVRPYYRERRAY